MKLDPQIIPFSLLLALCGCVSNVIHTDGSDEGGNATEQEAPTSSEDDSATGQVDGSSSTTLEADSSGSGTPADSSSSDSGSTGGMLCEGAVPYGDSECMTCLYESAHLSQECCTAAVNCAQTPECLRAITCLDESPVGQECLGAQAEALSVIMCQTPSGSALNHCADLGAC